MYVLWCAKKRTLEAYTCEKNLEVISNIIDKVYHCIHNRRRVKHERNKPLIFFKKHYKQKYVNLTANYPTFENAHAILFCILFMTKRTVPIIVGNWKSTPKTLDEGIKFIKQLEKKVVKLKTKIPKKGYYLAVPEIFIPALEELAVHGYIGAETVPGTVFGQVTGATIPSQLASAGANFVIVGHSEVRARGETKEERSEKVFQSLSAKLTTIMCVGEHKRDKEGKYLEELENDVKQILSSVKRELFPRLIIAYEPLWAIGGTSPATSGECFEAVIAIRRALASLAGIDYAKKVHILYGGTVMADNAKTFLEEGGVDGLLIGRASQEVTSFMGILTELYTH